MKRATKLANTVATSAGTTAAIFLALLTVASVAVAGLLFGFSEGLLLAASTTTTLVTFVMVFVIQHAQVRDSRAIQLKLDELVRASEEASNRLIHVQRSTDEELDTLEEESRRLRELEELERKEGGSGG